MCMRGKHVQDLWYFPYTWLCVFVMLVNLSTNYAIVCITKCVTVILKNLSMNSVIFFITQIILNDHAKHVHERCHLLYNWNVFCDVNKPDRELFPIL